jgi:hypothetical protein
LVKGISSLIHHERRTIPESKFNLARVNLTHTLGTSEDRSEATVCLSFRLVDRPPQATAGPYAHQLRRIYVYSVTTKPVFLSALQNVLPHVGACEHNRKIEWWEVCSLTGPIGY